VGCVRRARWAQVGLEPASGIRRAAAGLLRRLGPAEGVRPAGPSPQNASAGTRAVCSSCADPDCVLCCCCRRLGEMQPQPAACGLSGEADSRWWYVVRRGTCPHPTPQSEAHLYLLYGHLICGKHLANRAVSSIRRSVEVKTRPGARPHACCRKWPVVDAARRRACRYAIHTRLRALPRL
jgi:hypothetical protein